MSTDYLPRKMIPYNEIRSLNIEGIKIQEAREPKHSLDEACVLTDGENYLWARAATDGSTTFTRYGANFAEGIIEVLEAHFGTELISEHDDDFHDLVENEYRSDFITIQLPTPDSPGPWRRIFPVDCPVAARGELPVCVWADGRDCRAPVDKRCEELRPKPES